MRTINLFLAVVGACILISNPGLAEQDTAGCSDHPLFTRMSDFYIYDCNQEEFGQLNFKTGEGEKKTVEGFKTFLHYYINKGAKKPSALQIFRNFENAVKSIGGELLYTNNSMEGYFRIPKGGKVFWVLMYPDNGEFYTLKIIEEEAMEQEIVADAESLQRDIAMTGHATVRGIYFDFDKDVVKPESDAALTEVAKLLKANSKLKLYVVGHTDSKGKFDYNMNLSLRRAKAVAHALTASYGVSADRLAAHSVGPLAPVQSNKDDAGRAKNRRVELVEQ